MGRSVPLALSLFALLISLLTSCSRSGGQFWEDTKTATRYWGKGFGVFTGHPPCCSRQVSSREDFCSVYDNEVDPYGEFIPLTDDSEEAMFGMQEMDYSQPRHFPGEEGSRLPGIDQFEHPSSDPELAKHFQSIEFSFDSSAIKGEKNQARLHKVTRYLRTHPQISLFVEGHCDERGPEAYNLALGTRRANTVRSRLIEEGVDKNRLYTISFGKEHPVVRNAKKEQEHQRNRRVEFRVYRP